MEVLNISNEQIYIIVFTIFFIIVGLKVGQIYKDHNKMIKLNKETKTILDKINKVQL